MTVVSIDICTYLRKVADSDDGKLFGVMDAQQRMFPLKHRKQGEYRPFLAEADAGHDFKRSGVLKDYLKWIIAERAVFE